MRIGSASAPATSLPCRRSADSLHGRAVVTPAVQPGQLFIPMHYETTNLLTDAAFDPYSHQPAYKSCAVNVELAS